MVDFHDSWIDNIYWYLLFILLYYYLLSILLFIKVLPTLRNRDKKDALTGSTAPTLLIIKIVLDSMSRILLFSSWLYVTNHGHFSSIQTLIAYYTVFAVLVIFNIIFNDSIDLGRGKYWIGLWNKIFFVNFDFYSIFRNISQFPQFHSKLQQLWCGSNVRSSEGL